MPSLTDLAIIILLLLPLAWTYFGARTLPTQHNFRNADPADDENNRGRRFLLFAHLAILALLAINVLLAWLAPKILTFVITGRS